MNHSEKQTFLLGSNKLQLQLMAIFIADNANVPCTVVSTLTEVPPGPETKLILYDCKGWKNGLKEICRHDFKNYLSNNFLVLINVAQGAGIETEALGCGVRGFVYEHDAPEVLLKMIHAVFSSELWVSRNVMTEYIQLSNKKMPHTANSSLGLTSREIQILTAITRGCSNESIAEEFCISPHTVKTHVYHIFKKINVSSRLQAANWVSQNL